MDAPLLTPAEVAAHCRVSTKTVLRAIRSSALRAARLGTRGAFRVEPAAVDAWIARLPGVPQWLRDHGAEPEPANDRAAATDRGGRAALPVAMIEKRERKRRDGKTYSVYRVRWYSCIACYGLSI